jgi:hypothetical protein
MDPTSKQGETVTLYDYKETDLYSSDNPSVQEFRNLPKYAWHIGGQSQEQAEELKTFIEYSLRED